MSSEEYLEKHDFEITEEDRALKRLDKYLAKKLPNLSRNYIKTLFLQGFIESDENLILSKIPKVGTEVEVTIPIPEDASVEPENIPLEVLYEDEYLIIINKKAGIVVHPAPGNLKGTLVNALLFHCKDLKGIGNVKRPGIVHRLDKGTSGVMVMAKEQKTHEKLVDMFKAHDLKRQYMALTIGTKLGAGGRIDSLIARDPGNRKKMTSRITKGKKAITHYKVIKDFENAQLVQLTLETGRTHQIRVHLSQKMNAAIINDETYGNTKQQMQRLPQLKDILVNYPHPLLHAKRLCFTHPITKKELDFETPPPEIFQGCLNFLK